LSFNVDMGNERAFYIKGKTGRGMVERVLDTM
jgi:hypothetical protein